MPDYRSMYDKEYVGAWDLPKPTTVVISRVEARTLDNGKGKKNKKPAVFFEGREKGLACNATNGKTIAAMYGPNTEAWIGKRITLYAAKTDMAGETVDCVRVKPGIPAAPKVQSGPPVETTMDEPREAGEEG